MLKRLRRTWKEEEAQAQKSQSPGPDCAEPTPSPHELTPTPGKEPTVSTPQENVSLFVSAPKRSRDTYEPDATDEDQSERPAKLLKTGILDPLRNHLPEVLDTKERYENQIHLNVAKLKEKIFTTATNENTIADIPVTKASWTLLVDLISWAMDVETKRPKSIASRSRAILIVIEKVSSMDKYSAILETSLPTITIAKYTPEMHKPDLETWAHILKKDIVMIPSHLLLDSLLHGALAMTHIHFLVITDAQNIKNQDSHLSMPIVQVMNDFYRVTDPLARPRIFALMSAVGYRRTHFDSKTLKLEQALEAKVYGISEAKRSEILSLPDRPSEVVILYDTSSRSSETRLLKQLHQLDPDESVFRRYYDASRSVHQDIGSCPSDLVWRRGIKDIEATLIPGYVDVDEDDTEIPPIEVIKIKMFNVIKNWPFTMPNLDMSSKGFNVSYKFLRLVQVLTTFKPLGETFRGIIFVQREAIALVLADLLRTLDDRLGFLRPCTVVSHGQKLDPTYYRDIFQQFTTGVHNLLIATKSVEDLDVPKASVVIRYDLFESQVSHAYVRARTRGRESHLIHMVERGNDIHRRILSRITNLDADMLRWTETLCNSVESSVPPKSLRESINPYHSDSDTEGTTEHPQNFIKDPATSGRIYLQDATTVIYRYAADAVERVPSVLEHQPIFRFEDVHKEFGIPRAHICTIDLPGTPIHSVCGDEMPSKAQARQSACFKACQKLYSSGLLDCCLVPLPNRLRAQYAYERSKASEIGGQREAKPSNQGQGTKSYPRKQPSFWDNCSPGIPSVLYLTLIHIVHTVESSQTFAPLILLTKEPLPDLKTFRLFLSGVAIHVHFHRAAPLHVDEARMKEIYAYTMRLNRATFNKSILCDIEEMIYFFLPLPTNWELPSDKGLIDLTDIIPWDLVSLAAEHWAVPIKRSSPEELETDLRDAIVQDRWIEFTRRYVVKRIRTDLTPLSKPQDSPREASYNSLFDFCIHKRRGLTVLDDFGQPIIEVSKCHSLMNNLNPTAKPPSGGNSPAKYLIPELCAKFTIPASTLWTALLTPSIMKRVNDLLLVKEMNAKFFDHAIREDLLRVAICAPSAGMEYNYERLELLGDAFLKYLASVYVFVTNPSLSEGALHIARQAVISNKSLLIHATRVELPSYIQSQVFAYKTWLPPKYRMHRPPKNPNKYLPRGPRKQPLDKEAMYAYETQNIEAKARSVITDTDPVHLPTESSNRPEIRSPVQINNDRIPEQSVVTQPKEIIEEDSFSDTGEPIPESLSMSQTASPPVESDHTQNLQTDPVPQTSNKKSKKNKKPKFEEKTVHHLGDKAIADVAEAIIGAAYITGGRDAALQATKALTIPLSNIDRWSDFGRKVLTPPPNITAKLKMGSIAAIEKTIGHTFNRPHLLGQAMTHSSIQGYEATSYERLEFIGDAILDFMVIRHIFDRDQQLSPGALTMLKGAMVSNSALAAVCVWSGLHQYLLFESPYLETSIRAYAGELQTRQRKEYALAKAEGRSPGQYWLDIDPPKALSDVVESIAGAIYISDNFDPVGAEALFDNVLKPFYDKHITLQTLSHHPTKILFELLQNQGCQKFEITKDKDESVICRCHVIVHDIILASGEDTTVSSAARMASSHALDALEGDADFMTKTCDCRTQTKKGRVKSEFEIVLEKALAGETGDVDDR